MNFTPTQAVLDNIQRGFVLKQKYQRNSLVAKSNQVLITKAKEQFDLGFSLEIVKGMYNTLSKLTNLDFNQREHDSGPKEDVIKFYAFGGNAGLAWSRLILKQEGILKSHTQEITKAQTEQVDKDQVGMIPVTKSVNPDLMQVTYVAMLPGVDLHGDLTDLEDIRLAKESFNKSLMRANLFHLSMTDTFEIIESYLAPTDMILNSNFVCKGTWLTTLQILDETLWDMIKNDEITGVSIGATALCTPVE